MTKEKIGVVDKIAIEPLLGSEAGRRPGVQGDRFNYLRSAPGPVHGLNCGTQALNSTPLFATF